MDGARFALPPAGTAVNRNQSGGSQPSPPMPGSQPPLPPRPQGPGPRSSPLSGPRVRVPSPRLSQTLVSGPRRPWKAWLDSSGGRSPNSHPLPGLRGPITVGGSWASPPPPRPQIPPRSDSTSRDVPWGVAASPSRVWSGSAVPGRAPAAPPAPLTASSGVRGGGGRGGRGRGRPRGGGRRAEGEEGAGVPGPINLHQEAAGGPLGANGKMEGPVGRAGRASFVLLPAPLAATPAPPRPRSAPFPLQTFERGVGGGGVLGAPEEKELGCRG